MEFDLTRGDSDDERPRLHNWCRATIPHMGRRRFPDAGEPTTNVCEGWGCSQPQPFVAKRSSEQTVVSSEILGALEQNVPVTMPDSDSKLSRHVLCEVDNTNQRSVRRLVLCGDRGPTQESMAEVETAHDSVDTTPKTASQVRELRIIHVTHRWRMWRTRTVWPVVAEAIPMTLPKKTIESHCGTLGVIPRVPMMWRRRFFSVTQEFEVASWVSGRCMSGEGGSCSCCYFGCFCIVLDEG